MVRTDRESLKHFKTQAQVNRRLARFVDEIEFFDCYIIYRPGKDQLAADSLSRKPNTAVDKDPPEIQAALFSLTGDNPDAFTELTRQKRQLLSGFDPNLIGNGKFWARDGKIWQTDDNQEIGWIREVLCSYTEASVKVQDIHKDLGHRNSKDLMIELQKNIGFRK